MAGLPCSWHGSCSASPRRARSGRATRFKGCPARRARTPAAALHCLASWTGCRGATAVGAARASSPRRARRWSARYAPSAWSTASASYPDGSTSRFRPPGCARLAFCEWTATRTMERTRPCGGSTRSSWWAGWSTLTTLGRSEGRRKRCRPTLEAPSERRSAKRRAITTRSGFVRSRRHVLVVFPTPDTTHTLYAALASRADSARRRASAARLRARPAWNVACTLVGAM